MKTLKKIALFTFIGLLFITCKKEQLPPTTFINQPIFSFTGNVNSNILNWQAGVDNYYMYSSYSQNDSTGVYSFIGTLQTTSSPNRNNIQIIINDYKASALNASVVNHIDTALASSIVYGYDKGVTSTSDTTYKVTFTPKIITGTPLSYSYVFGDGGTSSVASPAHTYTSVGTYNSSLTVNFSGPGPVTMSNSFFKISKQVNPLRVNSISDSISLKISDTTLIKLSASVLGGTAPYTYSWVLGDSHTSTSATYTDPYVNLFDSNHIKNHTYSCALTVTDNKGATASFNHIIADTADPSIYRFDYAMSAPTQIITTKNSLALSDVTIIYTDGTGTVYTSKNTGQPGVSSFQILSVSDYKNNISNQTTKMLKVNFSCLLYPVVGTPIAASNCTAIIAVAYR